MDGSIQSLLIAVGLFIFYALAYVVKYYYKPKAKVDKVFMNAIFKNKTKLVKIAWGARVATIALKFKEYIETDLIDGKPDLLNKLEMFLNEHLNNKE